MRTEVLLDCYNVDISGIVNRRVMDYMLRKFHNQVRYRRRYQRIRHA